MFLLLLCLERWAAEDAPKLLPAIPDYGTKSGIKFPVCSLREFAGNALIPPEFFGRKQHFCGGNRKIPGSTGKIGILCAALWQLSRAASRDGSGRGRPTRWLLRGSRQRCAGASASARPSR